MLTSIEINETSRIPKYRQIINSLISAIELGELKLHEQLPSVNDLLIEYDISRDTIVKAYNYLKKIDVIESIPGKGYYVKSDSFRLTAKVFLLFNKLSPHKKKIYDSFTNAVGPNTVIDLFIYDNNYKLFKNHILRSKTTNYTHYVIISHFEEGGRDVSDFLKQHINFERLIVLDKKIESLPSSVASITQNFEDNIYSALVELNTNLKNYNKINLLYNKNSYQPYGIQKGFIKFCVQYAYEFAIIMDMNKYDVEKHTAYINLNEDDLVTLLKKISETDFQIGVNIGLVSYNDTPIKEVLRDGITVISTDFRKLGEQAAKVVLKGDKKQIENPFYVIKRNSL